MMRIGNRTSTDRGGDSAGANRRNAPYTPNAVNAYTGRTVPGYFDVVGTSTPDAVITVNGLATERQSAEWRKEIAVTNTSAAVSTPVTVAGSRSTSNDSKTGKVFTPKAAEAYTYDLDGNLLTDGRFIYTWDAENRLLTVQTSNAAALAGAAGIKRQFAYDYLGRRISKTNYLTVGSPGSYTYTLGTGSSVSRNLYSGWNLLAEIDAAGVPLRCYTWGLDLSGSLEGASGVGGLLFVENFAGGASTLNAAATDEMGNVVALADMASGALTASYEYGPFGEVIRQSGPLAASNPIRWSSRYTDDETGLVAYPRRVYSSSTGRWISRDPIEEEGGSNLYAYAENNGVNAFDPLGEADFFEGRAAIDWDGHPHTYHAPVRDDGFGMKYSNDDGGLGLDNLGNARHRSNPKFPNSKFHGELNPKVVLMHNGLEIRTPDGYYIPLTSWMPGGKAVDPTVVKYIALGDTQQGSAKIGQGRFTVTNLDNGAVVQDVVFADSRLSNNVGIEISPATATPLRISFSRKGVLGYFDKGGNLIKCSPKLRAVFTGNRKWKP